jgi:NAD+ synthase
MNVPAELAIDPERAINHGVEWVKEYFARARINTAVIGVSGGSDSALTAYICCKAIGHENVKGLIMPLGDSMSASDMRDAEELCETLGMGNRKIDIEKIFDEIAKTNSSKNQDRIAMANVKARIRMLLLYKEANERKAIVAGTDDRSEHELGYYTKYGDGGVDINVPEYLYKTQVRSVLYHLGSKENMKIFTRIAEKVPSPQLWKGHTAEGELGMSYEDIDRIFYYKNEGGFGDKIESIAKATGIKPSEVRRIIDFSHSNAHKNVLPPAPSIFI